MDSNKCKGNSLIHGISINNKGKLIWKDSFEELKKFVEEVLPTIDGEWGCPGGDVKQYKSVDLDLRWHPSTRSITLNGKLKENINEKLIHLALVTEQLNNKDIEHAATDKCRMNEPEVSGCNCAHFNADLEGIKLDMTILESRMFAAMSENEHESDIISLRVKLVEMEAVVQNQDEIISRLSKENLSLKSRLLNLEKLVHFMSLEYQNKSSGATDLFNITKEPSTRYREQSINFE